MSVKFKWFIHRYYLTIVATTFLSTIILAVVLYIKGVDWKILLTVIGGLISFIYFIQNQQIDEARLFKDLFVEFNRRYDALNGALNEIIKEEDVSVFLKDSEKIILYDYFNLCAEEYLFYCKGYIYPEVWEYWVKGMGIYFKNPRVRKEWLEEKKTASYYGLELNEGTESNNKPTGA